MKAPHDIKTDKTLIHAGTEVSASVERGGDGSVTIAIKCKKETVRVNYDTLTEAIEAGWNV